MPQDFSNTLPNGTLVGRRYRIVSFLNSGGFGNTYKAVDTKLADGDENVYVVLKEFFINRVNERDRRTGFVRVSNAAEQKNFDSLRRKFLREAKRIYRLRHPGIVRVSDVLPDENGTSYYVMDFIPGKSLSDLLNEQGRLSEAEALDYISQLLSALIKVHKAKMLHLDIKPGNIMLDANGRAVLIDFGASKLLENDSQESSSSAPMVYTPGYAPVEQMTGDLRRIGPAADLYAVGATLYRLLTNADPPRPTQIGEADSPEEVFPFPDDVSERTRSLVIRLMAYFSKDRPDNAERVYDFLARDASENTLKGSRAKLSAEWYESVFAEPVSDSNEKPIAVGDSDIVEDAQVVNPTALQPESESAQSVPQQEEAAAPSSAVPEQLFKIPESVEEAKPATPASASEPETAEAPKVVITSKVENAEASGVEIASEKAVVTEPDPILEPVPVSQEYEQPYGGHTPLTDTVPSQSFDESGDGEIAVFSSSDQSRGKNKKILYLVFGGVAGFILVVLLWIALRGGHIATTYDLNEPTVYDLDEDSAVELSNEADAATYVAPADSSASDVQSVPSRPAVSSTSSSRRTAANASTVQTPQRISTSQSQSQSNRQTVSTSRQSSSTSSGSPASHGRASSGVSSSSTSSSSTPSSSSAGNGSSFGRQGRIGGSSSSSTSSSGSATSSQSSSSGFSRQGRIGGSSSSGESSSGSTTSSQSSGSGFSRQGRIGN